jgi:hypothetical protein
VFERLPGGPKRWNDRLVIGHPFETDPGRNTAIMGLFSPAQTVGYIALALGITAFLQKSDDRLKFFNATQGLVYALHFILLGNLPASASSLISSLRSFLALRYRSWLLGAVIVIANVGMGAAFARNPAGWLPVIGSCIATIAIFTMRGVPFRSVLLVSTLLWLANNIISRSIGGTLLELANAIINISTMIRMTRSSARAVSQRPGVAQSAPL